MKYTIEAIPNKDFPIAFPNFHIFAERDTDGVMKAHIMDFDLWVYSQDSNDKDALEKIFERAQTIVSVFIIAHLKDNNIGKLYDNMVDCGDWKKFTEANNRNKMKMLQESYQKCLNDPISLKNSIESYPVSKVFSYQNLNKESANDLFEILARLETLSEKEAQKAIENMLNVFISISYEFSLTKAA